MPEPGRVIRASRLALALIFASLPVVADLRLEVTGARAHTGTIIASLFSSPDDYLQQPVRQRQVSVDGNGNAQLSFGQPAAGTYAISVVYDEDDNGELNTGLFGIPSEKTGFSNGAKSSFGPPSFEAASFHYNDPLTIVIELDDADNSPRP